MSLSLFFFILGMIFIIAGYTNQITPSCKDDINIKLVKKDEFNKVSAMNNSKLSSEIYPLSSAFFEYWIGLLKLFFSGFIKIVLFLKVGRLSFIIPKLIGWLLSIFVLKIVPPITCDPVNFPLSSKETLEAYLSLLRKSILIILFSLSQLIELLYAIKLPPFFFKYSEKILCMPK